MRVAMRALYNEHLGSANLSEEHAADVDSNCCATWRRKFVGVNRRIDNNKKKISLLQKQTISDTDSAGAQHAAWPIVSSSSSSSNRFKLQAGSENRNTIIVASDNYTLVTKMSSARKSTSRHRMRCLRRERLSLSILAAIACASSIVIVCQLLVSAATVAHAASTVSGESAQQSAASLNYLLFGATAIATTTTTTTTATSNSVVGSLKSGQNASEADERRLNELLVDTNHSHVSDAIDLRLANLAWEKMRSHALEFAQLRAHQARPSVNHLLESANMSAQCRASLNSMLDHMASLDAWAMQMYNAFGDFPGTGLFEGSLTSMGSYSQCVNVQPNELIGNAQYCMYSFQPIVPKRRKFHNILDPIKDLANFTNKDDMFRQAASKAHYFYYTKFRLATCMPSKCSRDDLESLGKQVAVNTYIQYAGVQCLHKQEGFSPDSAQVFALTVLVSLASVSLLGTLVHMLKLRTFFEDTKRDEKPRAANTCTQVVVDNLRDNNAAHNESALLKPTLANDNDSTQQQLIDLNGNQGGKHAFDSNTQQVLLPATKSPLLAEASLASTLSTSSPGGRQKSWSLKLRARALYVIDVLTHFSILRNGRKLFNTRTSRPQRVLKSGTCNDCAHCLELSSASSTAASDASDDAQHRTRDISCVHGLRFWTISWIIFGHTMQYTEWAGFGRAYQVEENIVSFWLQPFLNATFSVDTFFLVSGLLTTYVTWTITRGQYKRFNKFAFLISRYLRLTPQVLLVILIFIVFPLFGDGPYWNGLIQKESDKCRRNWWVNALYLQAFIKQDQICNLVTWWLSIEMFYHLVSIVVIVALLNSTRKGIAAAFAIGGSLTAVSCYLHYVNHYPPNMLPTLLQRYEIWDSIVLKYFWTPYPHAPAYFVGLLLGYVLYRRNVPKLTRAQVRAGWCAFAACYLGILFGTYSWNNNAPYERITSTVYYNTSQVLWAFATAWAILACALGHGGWLNKFLSSPVFVPLGRATYMTYLSHMIIVMSYPAKMNMLIEPSYVVFSYIFISNLFLSYALGIFLTLVYESPILHLQKMIVANMANRYNDDDDDEHHRHAAMAPKQHSRNNNSSPRHNAKHDANRTVLVSLYATKHKHDQA